MHFAGELGRLRREEPGARGDRFGPPEVTRNLDNAGHPARGEPSFPDVLVAQFVFGGGGVCPLIDEHKPGVDRRPLQHLHDGGEFPIAFHGLASDVWMPRIGPVVEIERVATPGISFDQPRARGERVEGDRRGQLS